MQLINKTCLNPTCLQIESVTAIASRMLQVMWLKHPFSWQKRVTLRRQTQDRPQICVLHGNCGPFCLADTNMSCSEFSY